MSARNPNNPDSHGSDSMVVFGACVFTLWYEAGPDVGQINHPCGARLATIWR